jgi:enoyl-CoA hydratase/carnithine racemase
MDFHHAHETRRMNAPGSPVERAYVRCERAGGVVTLTLDRGERFNPLSSAMIAALQAALDEIANDPHAQVVVLAGAGRGFCAGHDLKEMQAHAGDDAWQRKLFDDCSRMMLAITRLP